MSVNVPMKKSRQEKAASNLAFFVITGIIVLFCIAAYLTKGNSRAETEARALDADRTKPMDETIAQELKESDIPFLYQTDERWKDVSYGNGIIELKGCGPTCLSMVAAGLLKDETMTPVKVAGYSEEWQYVEKTSGTSWELMTEGAKKLGLISEEVPLDEGKMRQALDSKKPIICAMGPGDFTEEGHFIVLTQYKDGGFVIHDPNSQKRSQKIWTFESIEYQIRNIWCFSKA